MTLATSHTFKVWHPKFGTPIKYEELEFEFTYPVSRTYARDIVKRVEGYIIWPQLRKKKDGPYIHKPRARKAKS